MASTGLMGELWAFMRERKKLWLLPILIVLVAVGGLLVFAQGSALAPFIYTIFYDGAAKGKTLAAQGGRVPCDYSRISVHTVRARRMRAATRRLWRRYLSIH